MLKRPSFPSTCGSEWVKIKPQIQDRFLDAISSLWFTAPPYKKNVLFCEVSGTLMTLNQIQATLLYLSH
jgi:hypothetical protein